MKSLLHATVVRIWSLKHRVKFKTSCILSLTTSCLEGSLQGTLSRLLVMSRKSLGPRRLTPKAWLPVLDGLEHQALGTFSSEE
jgi:hypothetical protein